MTSLPQRVALSALLTAVLVAVGLVAAPPVTAPPATGAAVPVSGPSSVPRHATQRALALLRRWDGLRAQAWAADDPAALRALYVGGSRAARDDLRLLGSYRARGLVVRRMLTQVLAVEVLRDTPAAIRVQVLDRVAGGEVTARDRTVTLRGTQPSVHTIDLRRVHGRWRVGAVSGSGSGPHAAPRPRRGR